MRLPPLEVEKLAERTENFGHQFGELQVAQQQRFAVLRFQGPGGWSQAARDLQGPAGHGLVRKRSTDRPVQAGHDGELLAGIEPRPGVQDPLATPDDGLGDEPAAREELLGRGGVAADVADFDQRLALRRLRHAADDRSHLSAWDSAEQGIGHLELEVGCAGNRG